MNHFNLQIITPEKVVFSDIVSQATFATESGEITVLPNHIPLVTSLKAGELRYKKDGQEFSLAMAGGFAEVREDRSLVILADAAEYGHEIDVSRAEEAVARAKKLMEEARDREAVDYAALSASLERALTRLKVGNKYRKLPPQR